MAAQLLQGWIDDPVEVERICNMMPNPYFQAAPPDTSKDVMLHDMVKKAVGKYLAEGPQEIGDCPSFGFGRLVDYTQILDRMFDTNPDLDLDFQETNTESLYAGSRIQIGGGQIRGDGSVGAWVLKFITQFGAISKQEVAQLGEELDYSGERSKRWGHIGMPANILEACKRRPLADGTKVTSFEDFASHAQSGRVTAVCSNIGFANGPNGGTRRDAQGFISMRGTWAHCMTLSSVRFGSRPGGLLENQWPKGTYSGPMGDIELPDCSGWVDADVINRMLRQGDSWTATRYLGYPVRKLTWKF